MSFKKLNIKLILCALVLVPCASYSAPASRTAVKGQSVIQKGTTVRAKIAPTGLYSEECYNAYYGCMDQFCIGENIDGGSCSCSDENAGYEKRLNDIKKQLDNANEIRTVEVERIKAGAQADIIFSGERKYDAQGNVLKSTEMTVADKKAQKKKDLMALFAESEEEDLFSVETIADKTGGELYMSAHSMCISQMPASCTKDQDILTQVYAKQIKSDCSAFNNAIAKAQEAADAELADARAAVRGALGESFAQANKFDRGTCMVEFRNCMISEDACGKDWKNCVHTIASENMQNKKAMSVAGTEVDTIVKYGITDSTMEMLDAKRNICEKVLDQCVAVRNYIWPDFLREAAPTIRLAELNIESKMRQSCLTDISTCIQKACKDDIVGKGVDTMDSCLSRPEMARSFCKVEVDRCERMEPLIWGYVVDKLAAMRVDACTEEVKECVMSEDRCGKDFSKCLGMDYNYIHKICPVDKLVVCKKNNPKFSMKDLDTMLMGFYLNVDNAALEQCQNLVDAKMEELCGNSVDCNKFAGDDTIGVGSLRSQKDGYIYRLTGMISFGSVKMGNVDGLTDNGIELAPGKIGIEDYLAKVRERHKNPGDEAIISSIEAELNNIAGTINRVVDIVEQDPEIQFCIHGRNLSQITGKDEMTTGRFPNLLNQLKVQIAASALRQAQTNYNAKLNKEISEATKNASADLAQYMCQMLPANEGAGGTTVASVDTPMMTPYAISYDIGEGMNKNQLMQGGKGVTAYAGANIEAGSGPSKGTGATAVMGGVVALANPVAGATMALGSLLSGGSNKVTMNVPGGTKDMWSIFNREDRICHYCYTITTQNCKSSSRGGFLGIGKKASSSCETTTIGPECKDIPM